MAPPFRAEGGGPRFPLLRGIAGEVIWGEAMGKSGILPAEDPEDVVVGLLEPLEYRSEN